MCYVSSLLLIHIDILYGLQGTFVDRVKMTCVSHILTLESLDCGLSA